MASRWSPWGWGKKRDDEFIPPAKPFDANMMRVLLPKMLEYIEPESIELQQMVGVSNVWSDLVQDYYNRQPKGYKYISATSIVAHPQMRQTIETFPEALRPGKESLIAAVNFGTRHNTFLLLQTILLQEQDKDELMNEAANRADKEILDLVSRTCAQVDQQNKIINIGARQGGGSFAAARAALFGRIDALEWVDLHVAISVQEKQSQQNNVVAMAALQGHLSTMEWLTTHDWVLDDYTFEGAIRCGNLVNIEWLASMNCPVNKDDVNLFRLATKHGNVDLLNWLYNNRFLLDMSSAHTAAKYNHLHILQWLNEHGLPLGLAEENGIDDFLNKELAELYDAAATTGNVAMLKWLDNINCPSRPDFLLFASIQSASLKCIEWIENKIIVDGYLLLDVKTSLAQLIQEDENVLLRYKRALVDIVKSSDWKALLSWVNDQSFPLVSEMTLAAANLLDTRVFVFLLELHCPLDVSGVCLTYINKGNVAMVELLVNGRLAPTSTFFNPLFMDVACASYVDNKVEVITWLLGHGGQFLPTSVLYIASCTDLAMLQQTYKMKMSLRHGLQAVAKYGPLLILQWIAKTISFKPQDYVDAFYQACQQGHLEMMVWLYQQCQSKNIKPEWSRSLQNTREFGNLECLEWLGDEQALAVIAFRRQLNNKNSKSIVARLFGQKR